MEKLRLFVAIQIPGEIRRRLAEVEGKLKASGADVKWVPEQNFHVTLKFLGYVEPDRLDEVNAAVKAALEGLPPFGITLSGVGAFPKPSRPSVVWVGITAGGEELKTLAERIERGLEQIGFDREARAFNPHITMGRVRSPMNLGRLSEIMEGLSEVEVGSFEVGSVAVMRSDLRPTGPVYTQTTDCRLRTAV